MDKVTQFFSDNSPPNSTVALAWNTLPADDPEQSEYEGKEGVAKAHLEVET